MKTKLLSTLLVLFGLAIFADAQEKSLEQVQQTPVYPGRGAYIDANNNGICDYYESSTPYYGYGRGMGRASGPGFRRGMGAGQGRGLGRAKGWGRGLGPGQGRGLAPGGRYFVDEDKNGICDIYERAQRNIPANK